jgi:hypothetical protein
MRTHEGRDRRDGVGEPIGLACEKDDIVRPCRVLSRNRLHRKDAVPKTTFDAETLGAELLQTVSAHQKFDVGAALDEPPAKVTADSTGP